MAELIPAKNPAGQAPIQHNGQLPPSLEYRLRRLMSKITAYHQNTTTTGVKANLIPLIRVNQFGAVVGDSPSINSNALQVLAISPFSQAHKLGLVSGDTIVTLGKNTIDFSTGLSAHQILENYLNTLAVGQYNDVMIGAVTCRCQSIFSVVLHIQITP